MASRSSRRIIESMSSDVMLIQSFTRIEAIIISPHRIAIS